MSDPLRPPAPPPPAAGLRVLVVDDEPAVGPAIARLLRPIAVVFAQSATGALGRLAAGGRFDAILCDLNMPGMNGLRFYEAVEALSPELARRITFVSGAAPSREVDALLRRTGCRYLAKPFEGQDLRAVLAQVTGAPVP
jgi:two-component system, cell cycle sensor histidine kinase and response regulator CckA